jgi:Zn-dependent protease
MNVLIFLVCAIALHPKVGWADYSIPFSQWTSGPIFVAAMAVLQMMAALFNLAPVPPLDGFQAISPYMDPAMRETLSTPPLSVMLFIGYFLVIANVDAFAQGMYQVVQQALQALGFSVWETAYFGYAFNRALFGSS